ncbi:hypothetical protein [Streptomyces yaizuensis]|uniref:DUF3466 family protein n=1 Tax=Streptomyces yaizuensis TaxID=2989713 RepID=A0ABQ5PBD8_9ACTN|nr:hypothetical protein [Streptomyces sp. YSPA8]GLF99862.1 DUF3466 family protein [Streptomyces sp. YSPA8]
MSIGIQALRSAGAATIALATVCTLTLGAAGSATADTGPVVANVAVDLPLPPGAVGSYPYEVNDNGVIVGYAVIDSVSRRLPIRWNADLSATVLPLLPGDQHGEAMAVSGDGTAVGFSGHRLVSWAPDGTVTLMQSLPGDFVASAYVREINRTGTAVGNTRTGTNGTVYRAVKWGPDGRAVQLAALSGDVESTALSVNSSGTVAGLSYSASGVARPVKWSPDGTPIALDPTSAYRNVWVRQINDAGTVLAGATPTGAANLPWRSVTWNADGTVTDLGRHSAAKAINASGTAVGHQLGQDNIDYTATRWSPDGTAATIGADYEYTTAVAVNDAGVSVGHTGQMVPSDTNRYALRWEPDGTLTELNVAPHGNSYALFVNNAGLTVGVRQVTNPTPTGFQHTAVIWRP